MSIWFKTGTDAALLSAVLALTLSRRHISEDHGAWLPELAALPLMALGAAGVGWLLHRVFPLGALVLVAGIAGGVWLRRFGGETRRLGAMLTLPLVAMLISPAPVHAPGGLWVDLLLVLLAGVVALSWVWVATTVARRMHKLHATADQEAEPAARAPQAGQIAPSTRMAAQMAVALAASLAIGPLAFAEHWPWVAITAFIVSSSSVGRGDALYRSALRLGGAVAGTLLAAALEHVALPHGPTAVALMFSVLFVGVWLREVNYAIWACCITLIVALLQPSGAQGGEEVLMTLGIRLAAILVGAVFAVAAAWWVLPIRTTDIVRRYLADILLAMEGVAEAFNGAEEDRARALRVFEQRLTQLEKMASPHDWHHRLSRISHDADHPAVWINIARQYRQPMNELTAVPTGLVRSIKLARRTIRDRDSPITTALEKVRTELIDSQGPI